MSTSAKKLRQAERYSDDCIEPADSELRQKLRLRPTKFEQNEFHIDDRPCPSWCWVGLSNGEYQHEIDWQRPTTATHSLEGTVHVLASCYRGAHNSRETVTAATVELHLDQVGQAPPRIKVYLRSGDEDHRKVPRFDKKLELAIEDARELAIALNHLVTVAEG